MSLKILIVEDDPLFAVELEMLLKEIGYTAITKVDNSAEALEVFLVDKPDFALIDIDIKGKLKGTEVAEKVNHLAIPILFITGFDDEQHYEEAQKSENMVGYLVKPLSKYSLKSAIKFIKEKSQQREKTENDFIWEHHLFFKKKEVFVKVPIEDITFLEANDDYVNVHITNNEKFVIRMRLSYFEAELQNELFMRVHRSYIVQLNKVDAVNFQNNTLIVAGNNIPVNRANRDIIQKRMKKFS